MSGLLMDSGLEEGTSKYLIFTIGSVCYGLDVRTVTEIIGLQGITPVPEVPDYVRGVINLRGKVIPVMDVRARFRLEARAYHERTCIVVIEVGGASIGLVVDAVSEVLNIVDDDIEPPPTVGFGPNNKFISGLGRVGEGVKLIINAGMLIDVDRKLTTTEALAEAS